MWPFKKKKTEKPTEVPAPAPGALVRSNPERRAELLQEIARQKKELNAPAVVSLVQFFDGNSDPQSIAWNQDPPPGPRHFQDVFEGMELRPEIVEILLEITREEGVAGTPDAWPSSNTVYIVSRAPMDQVGKWLAPLEPSMLDAQVDNPRLGDKSHRPGTFVFRAVWR